MGKKVACKLLAFIFIAYFGLSFGHAEEKNLADLRLKLSNIRYEMEKLTYDYKQDLAKIRHKSAEKLAALKKEFHKTRDQYINEQKAQERGLETAYNEKREPLKREERILVNAIEPMEPSNFAKNR